MTTVTPEKADILRQALQKLFGVTVTLDEVDDALYALATYKELNFETLVGKYKLLKPDTYVLLAVQNTVPHNGAWARYIDYLKENYNVIVVQSIFNKRLKKWLARNGFTITKNNKDNMVWRRQPTAKHN
jgi:hypothetical protein|nr:MAG TPA: hypothetical protein [Bacteriophage sp.]